MLRLSETCRFLQSSSFWEARRALIGQLSSALWLAEYLKREMEMLRPLTVQTTSTTLHSSKLMFEKSVAETYLQAVSQKRQTVLAKLELPHFIETAFVQASIVG